MHKDAKLRTGQLISHCAMCRRRPMRADFVISDVALNIAPDTDQKRDICQKRYSVFARALGIDLPKVAVLARWKWCGPECRPLSTAPSWRRWRTVVKSSAASSTGRSTSMPQWTPKPRGSSISLASCRHRRCAIVPNIEAGKHDYKNLAFMADAQTAGLRGRRPGAGDPDEPARHRRPRRYSAAAAALYANALARDPTILLPETAE